MQCIETAIDRFKKQYSYLLDCGLEITGIGDLGDQKIISGMVPFVFDKRNIPAKFEDYILVIDILDSTLPLEFQIDSTSFLWYEKAYFWAPERFEKFVDRCADQIREKLGDPTMSRSEMLDALLGRDFENHKGEINEAIEKGELPAYIE